MNVVPNASTAHWTELARTIAVRCYGVEPRIEQLTSLNNAVFRLRFPDGCKILKLAANPLNASIRKELMLIGLLGNQGVPAPIVEYEDGEGTLVGRSFYVMNSAGEQTVGNWLAQPDTVARTLFTEMGSILARIHAITLPQAGDIQPEGIVPRDYQHEREKLNQRADWFAMQGLLEQEEAAQFKSLDMPPLDGVELCHGDFHTVHCIVHEGRIAAVVDWESAWAGNSMIDLAITHTYLDYYCPSELIRCFFAGYRALRSLPVDYDRAYLPVRMAQALGLVWVCYGQSLGPNVRRAMELFRTYAQRGKE